MQNHINLISQIGAQRDPTPNLGLEWDRVEHQSARLDLYDSASDKLRSKGVLYECFETPSELDLKRKKQLNMGKPPVYRREVFPY